MKAGIALVVSLGVLTAVWAANRSPEPTPSIPSARTPRTVVISEGGTHAYLPTEIAPGDKVICQAGGVGGTVPEGRTDVNGTGTTLGSSRGFRAWTDSAGTVHVTCPQHLATVSLQPAPRECPRGFERANPVPIERTEGAMGGHVPIWFPQTDFGWQSSWSVSGTFNQDWTTWTDQRCRTVTVYYNREGGGPDSWNVQYDKAEACGNSVMGMGECIGYRVALPTSGGLSVQTIGLSRAAATRLVRSIPL